MIMCLIESIIQAVMKNMGRLQVVSLDGDSYSLEEEVIESYEWNDPEQEIENGFLVVVSVDVIEDEV